MLYFRNILISAILLGDMCIVFQWVFFRYVSFKLVLSNMIIVILLLLRINYGGVIYMQYNVPILSVQFSESWHVCVHTDR